MSLTGLSYFVNFMDNITGQLSKLIIHLIALFERSILTQNLTRIAFFHGLPLAQIYMRVLFIIMIINKLSS